jgi:hypothetical protein
MIGKYLNVNYNNHNFSLITDEKYEELVYYKCSKCGLFVYEDKDDLDGSLIYEVSYDLNTLEICLAVENKRLTCDEIVIKNIIE